MAVKFVKVMNDEEDSNQELHFVATDTIKDVYVNPRKDGMIDLWVKVVDWNQQRQLIVRTRNKSIINNYLFDLGISYDICR